MPAQWFIYLGAESADATLARATELGGAVLDPPTDTPYVRLATATDLTGARFKLVEDTDAG